MKKFYSFVFAAVALVGFAACNSDSVDEAAPVQKGETVTFVANIDTTRTDLDGLNTIWAVGDTIVVEWNEGKYEFTNSEQAVNTFSCTAEGLSGIVGQQVTATYSNNNDGKVDSNAGVAGAVLTAEGTFGELSFTIESAFLKFTTKGQFADPFVLSNGDFTWSKTEEGTFYVAVKANKTTTLNYSIGGVTQKEKELTTVTGKIYNLGELTAELYDWGLVGQHQGWDIANPTPMYKVPNQNAYARCNVKLESNGFKFAKTGLSDWSTSNTYFGAWRETTTGTDYFNFSTEMGTGSWYGVYTNNLGGQCFNIGVSDFNKTYDIYVKIIQNASWGQELGYTVVEHGTAVTF